MRCGASLVGNDGETTETKCGRAATPRVMRSVSPTRVGGHSARPDFQFPVDCSQIARIALTAENVGEGVKRKTVYIQ